MKADLMEDLKKAGADELIFPLKEMAYTSLDGCTLDDLNDRICYGHALDLRISVLMNRLFAEDEITAASKELKKVLASGADAVYFADPGLMKAASEMNASDKMIYRSATLTVSSCDGAWWMAQGLQSVVLSPLLTKEEILSIATHVPECSLIIHGHLLMSISRRLLLDEYERNSSLRDNQELRITEENRRARMPVYENGFSTMIFTDFVQESFADISDFMTAGIKRFEIDADFLTPQHLLDAVTVYHSLLHGGKPDISAFLKKHPASFSTGYFQEKSIQ